MSVDPVYASWLTSNGLKHVTIDPDLLARWGETALSTERVTTLSENVDAGAEAVRQIAFLGGNGPLVIDEHQLIGEWSPYLGQVINITIDRLGYENGVDVFLIGAQDNLAAGMSLATVIRRLP